jgi:hypothetical protein
MGSSRADASVGASGDAEPIASTNPSDASLRFHFFRKRWGYGAIWLSAALVCAGLGVALLSRIAWVPSVSNQLILCAAFMFGISGYALFKASVELFSSLEIDARGILSRTWTKERRLEWSEILSYAIRYSPGFPSDSSIIFWVKDPDEIYVEVPTNGLSDADYALIRSVIGVHIHRNHAF